MIRVVIADGQRLMREGLNRLVSAQPEFEVIGEAANEAEVLSHVRRGGFDVLMMDLSMPGRCGIDLVRRVRSASPRLGILILTMHDEQRYAAHAISAGAQGYLTKENAVAEVIRAIARIATGRPYISQQVAEELALSMMPARKGALHAALSNRERQVFSCIVAGDTLTAVAAALNVSVKTISSHKARILQKMGMSSVSELVQYAIANGLLGSSAMGKAHAHGEPAVHAR
ncbi:MAG TPA: response regulator transcription factor [Telluria sp.]|jgi:DNA-binding NarL/FixJ family response regulator